MCSRSIPLCHGQSNLSWAIFGLFRANLGTGSGSGPQYQAGCIGLDPSQLEFTPKKFQLQADPSGTTRISGCISIPGETQTLPGESPEQPGVGSELALLGVGPPGVPVQPESPGGSTLRGRWQSQHQKSWLYLRGLVFFFFFLRQSRAISCSIIRLVKTRP